MKLDADRSFHLQRQHEAAALTLLTKTETGTFDASRQEICIEPVELPDEDEGDTYSFLAALRRTGNCLYEPFASLYAAETPFTTRINFKGWYGYTNVFDIDTAILETPPPGYTFTPIKITGAGGLYKGYVWIFHRDDSPLLGMIGIRSSLFYFLQRGPAGIASAILDKVLAYAHEHNRQSILIPQPLWAMREILKRRGFRDVKSSDADQSAEKLFIKPVCDAPFYYQLDLTPSRPWAGS
jgi:hypothetical protein